MFSKSGTTVWFGICLSVVLICCGCGQNPRRPVRAEVARETLNLVLDQWKSGGPIGQCQYAQQDVVVQDLDWLAGRSLLEFQVLRDKPLDSNLFATVQLKLGPEGSEKTVQYCVGTDPALTVFRTLESGDSLQ